MSDRFCPSPGASLFALLLAAYSPAVWGASVSTIIGEADAIRGPASLGREGDYLLENGRIRVVVSDVSHSAGSALSGGRIIDAAPEGGFDCWGQTIFMVTSEFPRQARYDEIEIVPGLERGSVAALAVRGADSRNDNIVIETVYSLRDGDPFVSVTTRYTNNLRRDLDSCIAADLVEGGRLSPFLPGYGFTGDPFPARADLPPELPAVLFRSEGAIYGWTCETAQLPVRVGGNAFRLPFAPFRVRAKSTVTVERRFYVWPGDIAGLMGVIDKRGSVPLTGRLTDDTDGVPAAGGRIEIIGGSGMAAEVVAGEDGRFAMALPPGIYRAVPVSAGGTRGRGKSFNAAFEQSRELWLRLPRDGDVRCVVTDGKGRPLAAKISVRDRSGRMIGVERGSRPIPGAHYTAGEECAFPLPPGEYTITASHGPEYSIERRRVEVKAGETSMAVFRLDREVERGRFVAVDLRQRTVAGLDSRATLEELAVASRAAGLDAAVIADRGTAPRSADLDTVKDLLVIGGEAVVLPGVGSFQIFPLFRENEIAVTGPAGAEGKSPPALFAAFRRLAGHPLIQVGAPRSSSVGYFEAIGIDPVTGLSTNIEASFDFDLLEVAGGDSLKGASAVLADWFHLLNLGNDFFATGGSSAGALDPGTVGTPRCYVDAGGAGVDTGVLLESLRSGRFFVTTGPLIDVKVNGRGVPGDLVPGGDGLVDLAIHVDAPSWIDVNRVRAFANGAMVAESKVGLSGAPTHVRLNESIAIYQDTWVVVVATGTTPLEPVVSGRRGEAVYPVAFTNPVWIDYDLNGRFDPPGVRQGNGVN